MPLSGSAPRRFHALDGLRAIAASLVVVHHSLTEGLRRALEGHGLPRLGHLLSAFTGSGVELFFVLSGVVLLRPYLRGQRKLALGEYLQRRVQRLWPPYLAAWAFAGLTLVLLNHFPTSYSVTQPEFRWTGFLAQAGILHLADPLYNDAWWSLAVEVLFYALVPGLVLLASRRWLSERVAFALFPAVALGSALLCARASAHAAPWTMFYCLGTYFTCFYGGIVIAKFDVSPQVGGMLVGAGAGVIALATAADSQVIHVGFGLLYAGVVASLLSASSSASAESESLAHPALLWLGERSYSLFLVHVTVFQLANELAAELFAAKSSGYFLVSRALGIPAALLGAMLLFWFVERRFARGLVTADRFWPPLRPRSTPAPVHVGTRVAGVPVPSR